MRITAEMLKAKGASCDQLKTFRHLWLDGVTASRATLRKAAEADLSIVWFARTFLSPDARKVYEAACDDAQKDHDAAVARNRRAFDLACADALWLAVKSDAKAKG